MKYISLTFSFRAISLFPGCIPCVVNQFYVVRHLSDPDLTHAGISTKDQTVNGKDYKKNDRLFLDIKASNVDVCFFFSLAGR